MYTGTPSYPDFRCRKTDLPREYTLYDLQKVLMAHPTRRIVTIDDLNKAKYGRMF